MTDLEHELIHKTWTLPAEHLFHTGKPKRLNIHYKSLLIKSFVKFAYMLGVIQR